MSREYSGRISLTKNSRGIYGLDTSIGCRSGMENNPDGGGCYGDCYAAKAAKLYGYDFSKTVLRDFKDEYHRRRVMNQINRITLDFVRIGCSGDPSEDWQHTVKILRQIDKCNKEIVIITKHWTLLTEDQLQYFSGINICINTSVSALDKPTDLARCLFQYGRLKAVCKSVLRIVSCDFNLENERGFELSKIQAGLFQNDAIIDTVFRPGKNNQFIRDGIINVKRAAFMGKKALVSKYNKKTYTGKCASCLEMCGVNVENDVRLYPNKRGITKQLTIF